MNTDKLLRLAEQHEARQASYRALAARYRQALADVGRCTAGMVAEIEGPAAEIASMDIAGLSAVDLEAAALAGISESQIKRLIAAKKLAERLRSETEAAAVLLKQSQALHNRLTEYARQRGETV